MIIHIVVNQNSIPYLLYFKRNAEALASYPEKIIYKLYCTELEAVRLMEKKAWVDSAVLSDHNGGSGGHADAVNLAIKNTVSGHINIIMDCDIVFLTSGWDVEIEKILEKVELFGASYLDVGLYGFGYGLENNGRFAQYNNMPNLSFFCMSHRHEFCDLDVSPAKEEYLNIDSEELESLYQIPKGFLMSKDVGWLVPEYIKKHKLKYSVIRHKKPSNQSCTVLGNNHAGYSEEFHWMGKPFLAHQRGSWKRKFRKDEFSKYFYNRVEQYLVKKSGYVTAFGWDKKLWGKWLKHRLGFDNE